MKNSLDFYTIYYYIPEDFSKINSIGYWFVPSLGVVGGLSTGLVEMGPDVSESITLHSRLVAEEFLFSDMNFLCLLSMTFHIQTIFL